MLTYDDVSVQIQEQSGKMTMGTTGGLEVVVTFDFIKEVDSDGNDVGESGPDDQKHRMDTFANTDFTIGTQYHTEVYGVPAKAIRFSAQLVDDQATLIITVFIFTNEGVISPTSTESFSIFKGSVKFNVELESWPFCTALDSEDPCQERVGAFIDMGIRIEGASIDPAPDQVGAVLELSDEVSIDGSWETLPEGYPIESLVSEDKNELYTFRFPKFASSMIYDPIIQLGSPVDSVKMEGVAVMTAASLQTSLAAVVFEGARNFKKAASSKTFLFAVALAACFGLGIYVRSKKCTQMPEFTWGGANGQPVDLREVVTEYACASAKVTSNLDGKKNKVGGKLADFDTWHFNTMIKIGGQDGETASVSYDEDVDLNEKAPNAIKV